MPQLSRRTRRATLVVHVIVSVGWLGLALCLLALALAGASGSTSSAEAAYSSMKLFADWLLPPLALLTLASGLVLSLFSHWGLARHRWVFVKFCLTLLAAVASLFAFRASVHEAAATVADGAPVTDPSGLIAPPVVSLGLYAFLTAISILKPWGLTRRGRRLRAERATTRPAAPLKTTRRAAPTSASLSR